MLTRIKYAAITVAAGLVLAARAGNGAEARLADVSLFTGTQGEGNMTPAAAYPNGMLNPGPDTVGKLDTACSGYRWSDKAVAGYSQWHLNGTGHPGLGDVLLFPFCGATDDWRDESQRKLDHSKEKASPGYYALETGEVLSEMTTSRRVNMFRFSRIGGGKRPFRLLVDLEHCLRRRSNDGRGVDVRTNETHLAESRQEIAGWTEKKSWGERKFAYVLEFSMPWTEVERISPAEAKAPRYVLTFPVEAGKPLLAKVAFSYSGEPAKAKRNLAAGIGGWDFGKVRADAAAAWAKLLSKIEVDAPEKTRRMFYTSLYHAYVQPNLCSDAF